jgi:hypothetical protein
MLCVPRHLFVCLLALTLAACESVPLPPMSRGPSTPAAAAPSVQPVARSAHEMSAHELKAELSSGARPPAQPVSMIEPLIEKRETLVATGYAVISVQKHNNPAQQRLLAIRASKLDAYRALTEQVYGQYLDSTTTVADMTVMSDTFRAKVEGVIYGAVLVSITPVGEDTYETSLSLDSAVVNDLRLLYLGQLASKQRARRAQ